MFSDKKNNTAESGGQQDRNRLSSNTIVKGEIQSDGNFRVDGTIIGELVTQGKVFIGKNAKLEGKLECESADVEGKLYGTIKVTNNLTLKSSSDVHGDIVIGSLNIEPGAKFDAKCSMTNAAKAQASSTKK